MKILLIGSGGREHALAQSLKCDPKLTKLFVAPGNPGISDIAECLEIDIQNNSEIISAGWTKVETVIGGTNDAISSFTFTISPNKLSTADSYGKLYITQPEVYETTYFDYQRGSVWSTESAFSGFRPGESYVSSGNSKIEFPSDYRKVTTSSLLKSNSDFYMPVCPLFSSPSFFMTSTSAPVYKHTLFSSLSNYKYFISDTNSNTAISGIYANPILTNKIVVKFNTYLSSPVVSVTIQLSDDTEITAPGVFPDSNGILILYLNSGNTLTKIADRFGFGDRLPQNLQNLSPKETMDLLAEIAKEHAQNLMDLGMNIDPRFAGIIMQTAGTMLGHAITAKTAKMDKKLKMISLQLQKARLDHQVNKDSQKGEVDDVPVDGQGMVLDRNELLKQILAQSKSEKK